VPCELDDSSNPLISTTSKPGSSPCGASTHDRVSVVGASSAEALAVPVTAAKSLSRLSGLANEKMQSEVDQDINHRRRELVTHHAGAKGEDEAAGKVPARKEVSDILRAQGCSVLEPTGAFGTCSDRERTGHHSSGGALSKESGGDGGEWGPAFDSGGVDSEAGRCSAEPDCGSFGHAESEDGPCDGSIAVGVGGAHLVKGTARGAAGGAPADGRSAGHALQVAVGEKALAAGGTSSDAAQGATYPTASDTERSGERKSELLSADHQSFKGMGHDKASHSRQGSDNGSSFSDQRLPDAPGSALTAMASAAGRTVAAGELT
jgi:hypothetical protein